MARSSVFGVLLWLTIAAQARAVEVIRIAVAENADLLTVEGVGLQIKRLGESGSYEPVESGRIRVLPSERGLVIDGKPLDQPDVRFRATGMLTCARERLRGELEIRRGSRGLVAVNILPLEEYLAAVLGSEMPPTFPPEALKAQAVAARTYAVRKKIEAAGRPYHLGATWLDQVYGGASRETPSTRAAVEATQGEVLTYEMEPIEAYFHSACGGHTEAGADALGRPLPYLQEVECPCETAQSSAWTLDLSPAECRKAFGSIVREVDVVDRSRSGRARRIAITLGRGSRVYNATDFRRRLGYERLRSLDFQAEVSSGGLRLHGKGSGHGAGMCQWGARTYADQGWDYRQILDHYYPGTELRKMY
jgi:stage II sporulation protein D